MPAKTYKLGPGELILGETGGQLDLSCQLTKAQVTWDKDAEDPSHVLCGDTVPGDVTYTAKLAGTVLQDLSADGVVDFTWTNKGEAVAFRFVPSTTAGRTISGLVVIDPIDVGGDVKTKPTSEFEWDVVGEPTLSAAGEARQASLTT
ncbi:major tail protein [Gordonia phage Emperor]|uniref:Major tail protein n=2 Tax=root TaxID=1 RepID=A0A2Z4Q4E0_9CAUD|nr:hypothetical protein [Gordonia westfalica]YP_010674610.1 major tail protein [Gordonia phage Emperor]AWY04759.1 major tail protein [Gordonia phage Emperor]SDU50414.1 hypothetical protein SAMN04488548_1341650 [Gordonia westfalica]